MRVRAANAAALLMPQRTEKFWEASATGLGLPLLEASVRNFPSSPWLLLASGKVDRNHHSLSFKLHEAESTSGGSSQSLATS